MSVLRENGTVPLKKRSCLPGEEVVISGMSGVFPKSDSVKMFQENLYNKVDMVYNEKPLWIPHQEFPNQVGKVSGVGQFDAQFFRVHYKQAHSMEPMGRKLLEHAYSAIYDSGINPMQLKGKKIGVFIGSSISESEKIVIYDSRARNGFGITGANKSMFANRISYWMDGNGPSYTVDAACASSTVCLEQAYRSISTGQCDAAIVGGCNLCVHRYVSLNFKRAGFLCMDGKTKCFDKKGDGYARSDAIVVLFIQKAKDAKRIYSEIYHAKMGYSPETDVNFLPIRKTEEVTKFLKDFYAEIDVSPKEVNYVEANGTGIAEADYNELKAISEVFAKDTSVKVGSVKSNMGHSEPASGVSSVVKLCLAFETKQMPANLHFEEPHDIQSIKDGKLQFLNDNETFNDKYAALNSFSYGGANVHVLLKDHYKEKNVTQYKSLIPYLILISGRNESSVNKILSELTENPTDPELIGLLHNIHKYETPGHMCRGYAILNNREVNNKKGQSVKDFSYHSGLTSPIWFVYSGMGSQWAGMGAELMKIVTFSKAIEKCRKVLEPKGIDIVHILTSPDKTIFDNILHSFVGIAAVQIGLTDVLTEMGIVPDNIIGHSVGELGCAYADGCFTAEEMILSAYSRGLVSVQTPFIRGSMAAVGLGYKEVLPICPPEIEVACHNSDKSATISGPADLMKVFTAELTNKGIFAKEVPCSNIAYHSRYIAEAGPGLLKCLQEVIKDPKPRSNKWKSTSVPQDQWETQEAQLSSAEYHTNNLLNPVLFEETSKLIPANAIVIEIAPHGLLQAILTRSLESCTHVPLTKRGTSNPLEYLLKSIGKLYEHGVNPDVSVLYPKIEFPVSTGTSLLSHLVGWEHSEVWAEAEIDTTKELRNSADRKCILSLQDDDYKYLEGHVKNGINTIPEAMMLVLVWETLAMQKETSYKELSVSFKNVNFNEVVTIKKDMTVRFEIIIFRGSNQFEVCYNSAIIATGYIYELDKDHQTKTLELSKNVESDVTLTSDDIYKILHMDGLHYCGDFRSIYASTKDHAKGQLIWNSNWVSFIDGLIQFNAFAKNVNGIFIPRLIKELTIDVKTHNDFEKITNEEGFQIYESAFNDTLDLTQCGGLLLGETCFDTKKADEEEQGSIMSCHFVPSFPRVEFKMDEALSLLFQIISENFSNVNLKVKEFGQLPQVSESLKKVAINMPAITINTETEEDDEVIKNLIQKEITIDPYVIFVSQLSNNKEMPGTLQNDGLSDTFIITVEEANDNTDLNRYKNVDVIAVMNTENNIIVLMKTVNWLAVKGTSKCDMIYMPVGYTVNLSAILPSIEAKLHTSGKVILVSEGKPNYGLVGLVQSLRKIHGDKIRLILVDDERAPKFDHEHQFFKKQIQKDLSINIYKEGQWGGFYEISLTVSAKKTDFILKCAESGNVESLCWVETSSPVTRNLIKVDYAGISFNDAQVATGKIDDPKGSFGMDFSGISSNGERVMGLVSEGSLATTVEADVNLLWPVPKSWSLADAATVPLPYVHAYYILGVRTALNPNHVVLVHGGAGALGQAVISLCLAYNLTVFTTVSSLQKKKCLLRIFPKLQESNIGDSRDGSFLIMVKKMTGNKRCDLVINCSDGLLNKETMECVGFHGIFFDIIQNDMINNDNLGLSFLCEARAYLSINLRNIFKPENLYIRKYLQSKISDGIAQGIVRPMCRLVYSPSKIQRAFGILSGRKNIGRVIVQMTDSSTVSNGFNVIPRVELSANDTYAIICSESDIGIELADRLVEKGATNLMIHHSSKVIDGYTYIKMESWKNKGVKIALSNEDLRTVKGCVNVLKDASKLGPLQGVFISQYRKNQNVKDNVDDTALIVANMDLVSRNFSKNMNYFVVITQSSNDVSNSFVNSLCEQICRERVECGLNGLCLQVGLPDEYQRKQEKKNLYSKLQPQTASATLNVLESCLNQNYGTVHTFKIRKYVGDNISKQIAKIFGLSDIDSIPKTVVINDLILDVDRKEHIRKIIKEKTKVLYTIEEIGQMNMSSLKNLMKSHVESAIGKRGGFHTFYNYIDDDECMAAEPLVRMSTRMCNGVEGEGILFIAGAYVILIPGFEGHHHIFQSISEELKIRALTAQLGPDVKNMSVQEMALSIRKNLKLRLELQSRFYILGYSFGVNVALELANILESEGHVGTVFCLDSSPKVLPKQLDDNLGNLSDVNLQNGIVDHMYRLMCKSESHELQEILSKSEEWTQKLDASVSLIKGKVNYSHQYQRSLIENAYERINLARNYKPNIQLQSEIVLIKAQSHIELKENSDDYGLAQLSKQPIKVYYIESDHIMAPQDSAVSNIINKHLSSDVLAEFQSKNLCETYEL